MTRVAHRLEQWRERALEHVGDQTLMLLLAGVVGLATGLLATLLITTISLTQRLAYGGTVGWPELLLVPTVGALAVGLIVTRLVPETSGSGIVEVMTTLAIRVGRFRGRTPIGGVAASGLALGAGMAGGREAPIVLIGGSTGSVIGQWFDLGEDRLRALVAAGAAAGIGASFNAPIGGMLFAVELLLGGFRAASLQAIVVSSVVGSVTARQLVGPEVVFGPAGQPYELRDPRELILYAVLGLAAVAVGLAFLYGKDVADRLLAPLKRRWPAVAIAVGGLATGLVALGVPEVLGTGDQLPAIDGLRRPIQAMVDGTVGVGYGAAGFLLLLSAAKIVAATLAVSAGNPVGIFTPVVFSGAALGGAVGHVAQQLLPAAQVEPGAFALVGMAAAFAAAARAPLTAVVLVFELTGDYALVLPLMLATGMATYLADRFTHESVFTRPLRQAGVVYTEPENVDILQVVTVGEVMTAPPDVVEADLPLDGLEAAFEETGHHGFPVVADGDRLVGVVTLADFEAAPAGARTARDICTVDPVTVGPDDPVFRAVARMGSLDVGRVPVVDPGDPQRLVGLVRRSDLVEAYRKAVARSMAEQQRRESSRLRDLAGVHFVELSVDEQAPASGRAIRDVDWPERTILTSLRREGRVVMPHGDTVLRPGDEVVVLTDPDVTDRVRALLSGEGLSSPRRRPPRASS